MRINERCVSGVDEDDGGVGGGNDASDRLDVVDGRGASSSHRPPSLMTSSVGGGLGVLSCLLSLFHGVSSDAPSSGENVTNATVINNNSTAANETVPSTDISIVDIVVLTLITVMSMFLIGVVLRICYRDGLEGRRGRANNNHPQDLVIEGEDSDGGDDQEGDVALRVVGGGDDAHESEEGEAAGADNGGGDDRPQLEVVERVTSL